MANITELKKGMILVKKNNHGTVNNLVLIIDLIQENDDYFASITSRVFVDDNEFTVSYDNVLNYINKNTQDLWSNLERPYGEDVDSFLEGYEIFDDNYTLYNAYQNMKEAHCIYLKLDNKYPSISEIFEYLERKNELMDKINNLHQSESKNNLVALYGEYEKRILDIVNRIINNAKFGIKQGM